MCLTIKDRKCPRVKKNGRINVYKFVKEGVKGGIITPCEHVSIKNGWFKAEGECHANHNNEISRGAIHCFTSKQKAKDHWMNWHNFKLIKCEALAKDFIANGRLDSAFKKIYISKKQIRKAKKWFQKHG